MLLPHLRRRHTTFARPLPHSSGSSLAFGGFADYPNHFRSEKHNRKRLGLREAAMTRDTIEQEVIQRAYSRAR
ncbi:hypothetical protein KC331_g46 [Hortaea werneckii]|nr:hypothetical protein KC331_g46 [Hortaea werneckii]